MTSVSTSNTLSSTTQIDSIDHNRQHSQIASGANKEQSTNTENELDSQQLVPTRQGDKKSFQHQPLSLYTTVFSAIWKDTSANQEAAAYLNSKKQTLVEPFSKQWSARSQADKSQKAIDERKSEYGKNETANSTAITKIFRDVNQYMKNNKIGADDYLSVRALLRGNYGQPTWHTSAIMIPLQMKLIEDAIIDNRHFNGFDVVKDIHRLVIDEEKQDPISGRWAFDNESHYLHGMLDGLMFMLKTLEQPISAELYEELHDICVFNVSTEANRTLGKPAEKFDRGFRGLDGVSNIGLSDNYTELGLKEFQDRNKSECQQWGEKEFRAYENRFGEGTTNVSFPVKWIIDNEKSLMAKVHIGGSDRNEFIRRVDSHLDAYKQTINSIVESGKVSEKNDDDVIEAIALCCQKLDQEHVFRDGNIRTIAFLVMNKLLLQNDLSPSMMRDPNVIDFYDIGSLVDEIKKGQDKFKEFTTPIAQAIVKVNA